MPNKGIGLAPCATWQRGCFRQPRRPSAVPRITFIRPGQFDGSRRARRAHCLAPAASVPTRVWTRAAARLR